jgi:SAM-dependent methyltransferase
MIAVKNEPKHPAKFSPQIIEVMASMIRAEATSMPKRLRRFRTLDPMAGTGRVHQLPGVTVGVELEPEWANMHPATLVGNCLNLPFRRDHFDCIAVSPCYGNRFADSHNAQDGSTRHSYTHDLGRKLTEGNAGVLHYRDSNPNPSPYGTFHRKAWREAARVLRPNSIFILNTSNFYANKVEQHVSEWHSMTLRNLGFTVEHIEKVPTPRLRFGANRERVEHEYVILFRSPA